MRGEWGGEWVEEKEEIGEAMHYSTDTRAAIKYIM
jgi:hypothetical protein